MGGLPQQGLEVHMRQCELCEEASVQRLQLLSRSPMVSDLKFTREPRHAVVLLHSLGSKVTIVGPRSVDLTNL